MDTNRTMAIRGSRGALVFAMLAFACVCGLAAAAQDLPKLPAALNLAKSADSPGQVTFNHSTHVDAAKPECTNCHPREFRILKADAGRRPPIKHADMDKGRQCGACHDGKKAFAMADDCTACHRG